MSLNGRIERLEASAVERQLGADGEEFRRQQAIERLVKIYGGLADRIRTHPSERPLEQQSVAERTVRLALAEADATGATGADDTLAFWRALLRLLRARLDRGAA